MAMIVQHAWCELRRRKARTLTTILGYSLAVSSMVILVGILQASGRGSGGILDHTGTHFVAFAPADRGLCGPCQAWANGQQGQAEGFVAFGTRVNLMPHAFVEKIKALASVADASPYLEYRLRDPNDGHLYTLGGFDPNNSLVVGTTSCAATDVVSGRFLTRQDKGKVLLEQAYAQLRRLATGSTITLGDAVFSVAGIVNPGIRPARADVYVPYQEAERLIGARVPGLPLAGQANIILVEVKDSSRQEEAIRDVKGLYPDLVISSFACYRPASQAKQINTTAMAVLVAAIGVFTILLAMISQLSVMVERRREVGILKTLGFSNDRILGQIVLESVFQAGAGAVAAVVCVLAVMPSILLWILSPLHIPVSDIRWLPLCGTAVYLSILGGLVAGLLPALWASRQPPSRLLRTF
jgi:putative ABC transport system permease protein